MLTFTELACAERAQSTPQLMLMGMLSAAKHPAADASDACLAWAERQSTLQLMLMMLAWLGEWFTIGLSRLTLKPAVVGFASPSLSHSAQVGHAGCFVLWPSLASIISISGWVLCIPPTVGLDKPMMSHSVQAKADKHQEHQLQDAFASLTKPGEHHQHQLWPVLCISPPCPSFVKSTVDKPMVNHSAQVGQASSASAAGCFAPLTKPGEHHQHQRGVLCIPPPSRIL